MNLNYLKKKAYDNAKNHGWHDKSYSDEHWAMLIITEIGEAVQADRSNKYADLDEYRNSYKKLAESVGEAKAANLAYESFCKNTFEDELADICIRTLDMAGAYDTDLSFYDSFLDGIIHSKKPVKRFSEMLVSEWGFDTTMRIVDALEEGVVKGDFFVILRQVFNLARAKDIDIMWFIENKMLYNESRPYRHGGKKY